MLIARKIQELDFSKLMEVYIEGNIENGRELYPQLSAFEQMRLAEDDFYRYLTEVFFKQSDAVYFALTEGDRYISALRTELFLDGVLLQALETRPDMRRQGYAKMLMLDVLDHLKSAGCNKVYSHISKRNIPSLKTHIACGFTELLDYAAYVDGTVSANAVTMCLQL